MGGATVAVGGISWDVIDSASSFSTFSSVLAAFMFAGIVLLITRELHGARGALEPKLDPPQQISPPIVLMLGAFFQLVVAAFLFAAMAGDTGKQGFEQFVQAAMPCATLALGVVEMSVALMWVLSIRLLSRSALEISAAVIFGAIVIAAFFLSGVVLSPAIQPSDAPLVHLAAGDAGTAWIAASVVGSIFSVGLGLGARPLLNAMRNRRSGRPSPLAVVRVTNFVSIAVAAAAAIGWNVVSSLPSALLSHVYDTTQGNFILALGGVVVVLGFAVFVASMPALPRPDQEDEGGHRAADGVGDFTRPEHKNAVRRNRESSRPAGRR